MTGTARQLQGLGHMGLDGSPLGKDVMECIDGHALVVKFGLRAAAEGRGELV